MHSRHALALIVCLLAGISCGDDDEPGASDAGESGGSGGKATTAGNGGKAGGSAGKGAAGKGAAGKGSAGTGGTSGTGGTAGDDSDAGVQDTSGDTDYAKPEHWLCRPDHNESCAVDLDTTIVKADGSTELEKFKANADAEIDCFYVYPTVSLDATPNSDLVPGDEEKSVVRAQFARFASQCRLYAPLYRQVTLTALRASIAGTPSMADQAVGYRDVLAAWNYYLEHDNNGRGVVLVGHSQGSSVLSKLVKEQLDKDTLDKRFMSALLLGTNVLVPKGEVTGGTFQHVKLCKSQDELGCIIVYASFRDNTPPSETTTFASSKDDKLVAGCTNPAALGGGSSELHAYLSTKGPGASSVAMGSWVKDTSVKIETPFVSVPGLLSGECKFARTGEDLAITVHGNPDDARTDDIVGDVTTNGEIQADWGLHLLDPNLTMGNLLDLVKAQTAAYKAR